MNYIFNKTCIGYSHLKNKKPCQDFSASYKDNERTIITCCDGHGGSLYIRSDVGSKLASDAIITVFKSVDQKFLRDYETNLLDQIKLLVLCEYNRLVESALAKKPIRKWECKGLSDDDIERLRLTPVKAYGTTLSGAMIYRNKCFVISIGDTETLAFKDCNLIKLFDNSDDPAGNITYSMCQEDAYQYMRMTIFDFKDVDGVLLCTDGMSSPYQSYVNFNNAFVKPVISKILKTKSISSIEEHVNHVALQLGVGDEVSLSFILSDKAKYKYYL